MSDGWYVDSDNQVIVKGLRYSLTGQYANDAVVTGQMYDDGEAEVGDEIAFQYQTDSDGDYVGVVPMSLGLVEKTAYTLVITIVALGYTHTQRVTRIAHYDDRVLE